MSSKPLYPTQRANHCGIDDLAIVIANLTRWEGHYNALSCLVALQPAIIAMHTAGRFSVCIGRAPNSFPVDFLAPAYWKRMEAYQRCLESVHAISKAAQSKESPTLSCVPHWIFSIRKICILAEDGGTVTKDFKTALLSAMNSTLDEFVDINIVGEEDTHFIPNAIGCPL